MRTGAALAAGGHAGRGAAGRRRRARRADRRRRGVRRPAAGRRRHRPRRRRAAARPGRHPRARQRARPHRVGGLRHRHPGRRGRRRHHDRRHAAQQPAAHRRPSRRCATKQAAAPGSATSTSASGAARSPATPADLPAPARRRRLRLQGFLVDSGVPEFPPLDRAGLRGRAARRSTRCSSCTPRTRTHLRAGGRPPARTPTSSPPGRPRPRSAAVRAAAGRGPRRPARGCTSCTCPRPAPPPLLAGRARDGRAGHRRDLPALPDPARRGRARRRHRVQVLPADPRRGTTGTRCGPRLADGDDRLRGVRPLAVPARAEGRRATSRTAWGGIASLQLGLPVVWTEARRRGHGSPTWCAGWPRGPADARRAAAQGPDRRRAPTPTWSRSTRTATFVVDPAALHHRHPVTPYAGRPLPGVVRATWLRGEAVGDGPRARPVACSGYAR